VRGDAYTAVDADGNEISFGDVVVRASGSPPYRGRVLTLWWGQVGVHWSNVAGRSYGRPIRGEKVRLVACAWPRRNRPA
jgi:hypothetical protein